MPNLAKSAAIVALISAGCTATHAPSEQSAAAPTQSSPPHAAPADPTTASNAILAPQLEQQLHWLTITHDQGRLSDSEYQQARATALARIGDDWVDPMHTSLRDSKWLHDELDYLAQMQQKKVISAAEFENCRALIVKRYLRAIGAPAR